MLEVDLVTPLRKIGEGIKCGGIKIPGHNGDLEVLPGHTELLTLLRPGILSFTEDGTERKFAVSFGFVEVRNDRVIICAETAEEASEIDADRAKNAQKKAEAALSSILTETDFKKHQLKLERSLIRQGLVR